jgi:hypothetical protein
MEEFSEEKYPFQCISCPLKFSNVEGANIHFLDGHEKQKEVEIEELPLVVEIEELPEVVEIEDLPKGVEIEELPRVVGQIVKAPSKVKKSGSSENKVIYLGVLPTGRVV